MDCKNTLKMKIQTPIPYTPMALEISILLYLPTMFDERTGQRRGQHSSVDERWSVVLYIYDDDHLIASLSIVGYLSPGLHIKFRDLQNFHELPNFFAKIYIFK